MNFLLLPFALVYGLVVIIRNKFFDWGLLRSESYSRPVISVGNLNTGGSGKTPHVEYLIRLLENDFTLATLSRGYKRRTRGFMEADEEAGATIVGDEPTQFRLNFNEVKVAVDEKRKRGIDKLITTYPHLDAILLDDAFQHRHVRPGLSILLTDFRKPYFRDFLLPVGNLREPRCGARRADIIIFTKSPKVVNPIERKLFIAKIKPRKGQHIFFSYIRFFDLLPLPGLELKPAKMHYFGILVVAGIVNPTPMEEFLQKRCSELDVMHFRDHHQYTVKDITRIRERFDRILSRNKIIVTTEKDAMRLKDPELLEAMRTLPVYYVPIRAEMNRDDKAEYDAIIKNYVEEARRNR